MWAYAHDFRHVLRLEQIRYLEMFMLVFKDERTFSEDEEEKLQGALDLSGSDLELVLQTLEFFLQQVCNHGNSDENSQITIREGFSPVVDSELLGCVIEQENA